LRAPLSSVMHSAPARLGPFISSLLSSLSRRRTDAAGAICERASERPYAPTRRHARQPASDNYNGDYNKLDDLRPIPAQAQHLAAALLAAVAASSIIISRLCFPLAVFSRNGRTFVVGAAC
jgi:pyruvoyl-dependent arginine decarboxylase (PvlArgDC)